MRRGAGLITGPHHPYRLGNSRLIEPTDECVRRLLLFPPSGPRQCDQCTTRGAVPPSRGPGQPAPAPGALPKKGTHDHERHPHPPQFLRNAVRPGRLGGSWLAMAEFGPAHGAAADGRAVHLTCAGRTMSPARAAQIG